ncbi:MAG: hypothetical protein A2583_14190 [Bdellovibrionales bacterium RIFOXYD1_FULL_53_11]|nr:MAG: hypothetical protein A2583_14190 [Bdellovibrionales bacterium RIFOXYD1_FULL_53_11]
MRGSEDGGGRMIAKSDVKAILCTVPLNPKRSRAGTQLHANSGIICLINYSQKRGYDVDFYDLNVLVSCESEVRDYFSSNRYDIVGISVAVSTGYYPVKRLAAIIREASPDAIIVVGCAITASANVLLRKTEVDVCVLGNGQKPWLALLDYVRENGTAIHYDKFQSIQGLAFMDADDELVFNGYGEKIPAEVGLFQPDYEILKRGLKQRPELIADYFCDYRQIPSFNNDSRSHEPGRRRMVGTIWTTRGCVAKCTFCQQFIKGMQNYTLEAIERTLVDLKEKYNVGFILINDDCFGLPVGNALEIAKLLNRHGFVWSISGHRCTTFKREHFELFRSLGCTWIGIGTESASQDILDIMEKKFQTSDIVRCFTDVIETGLPTQMNICIGMPGESNRTVLETAAMGAEISRMMKIPPATITGITYAKPFPGTPLYEYGQLVGCIGESVEEEEQYLLGLNDSRADYSNFINLTSMSERNAAFWAHLYRYEATRQYFNAGHLNGIKRIPLTDEVALFREIASGYVGVHSSRIVKTLRFCFHFIAIMNEYASRSSLAVITRMPRPVLYGFMRNLFYCDHLFKKAVKAAAGIFKSSAHGALEDWCHEVVHFRQKRKAPPLPRVDSLRRINRDLKMNLSPPASITEKNWRWIREGQ